MIEVLEVHRGDRTKLSLEERCILVRNAGITVTSDKKSMNISSFDNYEAILQKIINRTTELGN